LGFAQRKIHASRSHIPTNRKPKKAVPTTVKTLGDYIQTMRFKKGLHQCQLAEALGVPASLIALWEKDRQAPTEDQWTRLAPLLNLDPTFVSLNPTVE
jgi:ribosome-binding protein aMBF1 (putative translation factor)